MKKSNKLLVAISSLATFSVLPVVAISCSQEKPKTDKTTTTSTTTTANSTEDKKTEEVKSGDKKDSTDSTNVAETPKKTEETDKKADNPATPKDSTADNKAEKAENTSLSENAAKIMEIVKASNKDLFVAQSAETKAKLDEVWAKKGESRNNIYVKKNTLLFGVNSSDAKDKTRKISLEWKNPDGKPSVDVLKNMLYHYEYGAKSSKYIPLMKDQDGNYFFKVKLLGDGTVKDVKQPEAKKVTETFDIYL